MTERVREGATPTELLEYRPAHQSTVTGAWIPGELLCFARSALRSPISVASMAGRSGGPPRHRLLVAPGLGFVRLSNVEPVHRTAQLELGVQGDFDEERAGHVLVLAREAAFRQLNLRRIFGWMTPGQDQLRPVVEAAGFRRELCVPDAVRMRGRSLAREIWGMNRGEQG